MEKTILSGISIIFAFIGLYFVLRIWYRWQYIDMDVLKARGFLDKKFLTKNWIYTFLAGASLTAHYVIQFMQSLDYIPIVDWIVQFSRITDAYIPCYPRTNGSEWSARRQISSANVRAWGSHNMKNDGVKFQNRLTLHSIIQNVSFYRGKVDTNII